MPIFLWKKFAKWLKRTVLLPSATAQLSFTNSGRRTSRHGKSSKQPKDYSENSAMAQEYFISDSLKLDQIRMEQRKVKEIEDVLSIIESFIRSETWTATLLKHSGQAIRL